MTIPLDPVKVIDADTHLTERHDLWTKRAPASLKDRVPARHRCRRQRRPGSSTASCSAGPAPAASSTSTGVKGRSFEGPVRVGDRRGPRGRVRPGRPARADGRDRASRRRSSSPASSGSAGRRSAERRAGRRAAHGSASRSSTTPTPSCRPSRATGCCRWRSCPRGTSTRACAKRERAAKASVCAA